MIVLDTHAFLWLASAPERLGRRAARLVSDSDELTICTVSVQEIAFLVARGRIEVDRPLARWIGAMLALHRVEAIAPDVGVALRAGSLDAERFPGNPADRLIYATAREHDAMLVSADERLQAADPERVVW